MTDHDDEQMPRDPVSDYDAERIARETGGQITGRVTWEGVTRLTIGAVERGIWPNLVAVRLYDHEGKPAGAVNLGIADVDEVFRGLHEAVAISWPAPPDPAPEPRTDWGAPPGDDEPELPCPRCGYVPGDDED